MAKKTEPVDIHCIKKHLGSDYLIEVGQLPSGSVAAVTSHRQRPLPLCETQMLDCFSRFSHALSCQARNPLFSFMACSTAQIAAPLIRIHTLMIAIGYIDSTDIKLPLHDAQIFPVEAYRAQNISEKAIDFILNIPWMTPHLCCKYFLPGFGWPMHWSDEDSAYISRVPDLYDIGDLAEDLRQDCDEGQCYEWLRPDQVPLNYGSEPPAELLIIDVVNCEIITLLSNTVTNISESDRCGVFQLGSPVLA